MKTEIVKPQETVDLSINESMDTLSLYMLDNLETADIPFKHTFVPGLYIREMIVEAGVLVVGKKHLTEDPFAVMTGSLLVFNAEDGEEVLHAGHTGITKKGTRRVGYGLEDCKWINYHALSREEERARKDGMSEEDLINMVEERIFEKLEPLPDRGGRTLFEMYKEKLKGVLTCQE